MKPLGLACIAWLSACSSSHEANAAGEVVLGSSPELARAIAQREDLRDAQAMIDSGHPWRATQLLAPILRDSSKRTPEALIVAARAAVGWEGWAEVDKLLASEKWIDTQFDGTARELLTRSALERGADTVALVHAELAARAARETGARAARLVLLGRALERNNLFDSAAATYARAGSSLSSIRDWLQLRAAGTERDSAARARLYATVTLPVAKPRIAWTEAQTRERMGDALGAASRYAALGAPVTAFRLRLSVAPDSASRDAIKSEILAYMRSHSGTADARTAVEILDKSFTKLSASEEIVIARSLAVSGPATRANTAFERARAEPSLVTPSDRLAYAQTLVRAGRTRDALPVFATVDGPLAAQASYQRARALLTSGTSQTTRQALRDVVTRFPRDTGAAGAALYLLADLLTDDGNDAGARSLFRQLYREYPTSARAADARIRAALIVFAAGSFDASAKELDSLTTVMPRSAEVNAARYWSGRAWKAAGNASNAVKRWREVIAQQPVSYYAVLSARRLDEPGWVPSAAADSVPRFAAIDSAMTRASLLDRLGMDVEARFEYDALEATAGAAPDRLFATAQAFLDRNQPSRAIRLAQRLVDGGRRDARAYRLLFPILHRDELTRNAKAHDLDPAFVAGLVRQESNFNARAVSIAGARGFMQVLPPIGAELSRAARFPVWYPVLLFNADANLQLGTAHLAAFIKQYRVPERALAAYNAGGSRVSRWVNRPGTNDPELFVERIPFVETRDYVRAVIRNEQVYRALYP